MSQVWTKLNTGLFWTNAAESERKKKVLTSLGRVELKKSHVLCKCTGRFRISERLQGLICLLGEQMVFADAEETFKQMLELEVSAPQIQRVCGAYGNALDPLIEANCEAVIPRLETNTPHDIAYVMLDGSMIFTRENEWREMKLGRVFYKSQVIDIQCNRREIAQSVYVSHLGSVNRFLPKFERFLTPYKKKVILADGASWIWNWAEDNYPGATQILDFYHAQEKLVIFARHQFAQEEKRKSWVETQKSMLLNNQIDQVITHIARLRPRNNEALEAKQKTLNYYREHDDRMQYKTYLEKELLIGSGPIEAAHRSVIQQRMKLSGQKWSIQGAQAIANLRCFKRSNAWSIVQRLIAAAA